jgi:hypothetical protein
MVINKRAYTSTSLSVAQRYAVKVSDTTMLNSNSNAGPKKEKHDRRFILLHSFALGGSLKKNEQSSGGHPCC